jgi:hypothetical protein
MKSLKSVLAFSLSIFFLPQLAGCEEWGEGELRLTTNQNAVFWYLPSMPNPAKLAGYDMVIIDPENQFNNPEVFKKLREKGAKKILMYNGFLEWFVPMFPDKPWGIKIVDKLQQDFPQWFLKQADGKPVVFWEGTKMMNISLDCPKINGQTYVEWAAEQIYQDILSTGLYDGMLVDNLWTDVSWLVDKNEGQTIDLNADGIPDTAEEINKRFHDGYSYFLSAIRAKMGKNFLILGNYGSTDYIEWANGKQFENFPDIYLGKESNEGAFVMTLLNAKTTPGPDIFNAKEGEEWWVLLSSKLIDNVYFAYKQNSAFRPEYASLTLGQASATLEEQSGIYSRRFQNGTVYVNPEQKSAWIEYSDGTKRSGL